MTRYFNLFHFRVLLTFLSVCMSGLNENQSRGGRGSLQLRGRPHAALSGHHEAGVYRGTLEPSLTPALFSLHNARGRRVGLEKNGKVFEKSLYLFIHKTFRVVQLGLPYPCMFVLCPAILHVIIGRRSSCITPLPASPPRSTPHDRTLTTDTPASLHGNCNTMRSFTLVYSTLSYAPCYVIVLSFCNHTTPAAPRPSPLAPHSQPS